MIRLSPSVVAPIHRWSGRLAILCVLPVAFHCIFILGFRTTDTRVLVHSIVGSFVFGVIVVKLLMVHSRKYPGWALPRGRRDALRRARDALGDLGRLVLHERPLRLLTRGVNRPAAADPGSSLATTRRDPLPAGYDRPVQEYVLSELDTGERLITERVSSFRSVSLGFWIGAGSRDEPDSKAGVSHFIEHLLFKGTRSYSALEIAEIFDELGGELNAATSRESTVVFARVPDRHLETALDVMADMVFSPTFADLETEREVVLEEIAMLEDTPQDLVHDLLSEAIFAGDPLGRHIIGRADVISTRQQALAPRLPPADVHGREHRARRRRQPRARPRCWTCSSAPRTSASQPPEARTRVRKPLVKTPPPGLRFQRKDTEQYHVCVGGIGVSRTDRRRFAASLLDAILGGSASSRLFQEIREKRGMAYAVYSFASQYADTGLIGVYVGTREENLDDCFEIVAREIADIAAGNVHERELRRAKENLKGRIALSMESTSNRMSRLGKSLITDTELLSLDRIIAEIDAVDADGDRRARGRAAGAGRAVGERHRPGRGPLPRRRRADPSGPARPGRGVKVAVFGARGKVGRGRRGRSSRRPVTRWCRSTSAIRSRSTAATRRSTSRSRTRS